MKNKIFKYLPFITAFVLLALSAQAQDAATTQAPAADNGFYEKVFSNLVLIVAGVVLLGALAALTNLLNVMIRTQQIRIYQEHGLDAYLQEVKKPRESFWARQYKRWTNVIPVEKEETIVFHHDFDGIRELDNSLPPWWIALFAITAVFAVIYMGYYHFGGSGPSSAQEYAMEVQEAQVMAKAALAKQANNVDETNVVALTDEQSISIGKNIWSSNCVACHGAGGEGGVGPNMTDEFWIHGGGIQNIFKIIKYGVPEKGMIAWSTQLRPTDMQRVASFILTLQGTNPPNPKAPQGTKYEAAPSAADTTKAPAGQTIGMK